LTEEGVVRYTTHVPLSDDRKEGLSARREGLTSSTSGGKLQRRNGLAFWFQDAALLIDRDRVIQDRTAVNAFPRMEHEEEIRKSFQRHQPFTS
jgi:hypothetical protein